METSAKATALMEIIMEKLASGKPDQLREVLAAADSVDIAEAIHQFGIPEKTSLFGLMGDGLAADVFVRLDDPTMELLIEAMGLEFISRLVPLMEPDDGADLVGMLEERRAEMLLAMLGQQEREAISYLLAYDEDSAGGLMDPDVVSIRPQQTVAQAVEDIRSYVERVHLDDFFSIFVVSGDNTLLGSVPNWKMLLARPEQLVSDIMEVDVVSVEASMDQEEISHLVRERDLVVVPVVDGQNRLIGRITVDDIVDVIDEEHQEDLGRLSGTGSEEVGEFSIAQTIRLRAPWLFVALAGEFILALFMSTQQEFLAMLPQLAFFIPLIMAMGGNTGIQSSSLVIRGLATGEVRLAHFRRRILREVLVAVIIGCLFAAILIAGGALLTGMMAIGLAVGLATLCAIILAAIMGTAIPMLLRRLGHDPALATGPFITTLNDMLGILLYLTIAYLVI